jgi:3-oxoacyl-[acyl-carrier protein] reductase
MTEKPLRGRVALVTGGARGLGRGYVLRLAELGADVAILDRNLDAAAVYEFERNLQTAATVEDECAAHGVRALAREVDLTDRAAAERAVSAVVGELGGLDIVVCNAGGGTTRFADEVPGAGEADREAGQEHADVNTEATASDCPQEVLTRVLEINLMTCMYTCMAVVPYLKRRGGGKIVTVSSTAGLVASGGYHPYGTAKAAIVHYTRALAQELGPHGINVNCIAPGIIRTGRLGDRAHLAPHIPLRREGTIEDCVRVVEFLVTDRSDYVTGCTIPIDGGLYH